MRKVWVAGAKGRVGDALHAILDPDMYQLLLTDREEVDVTDLQQVHSYMNLTWPDVVINCASLSDMQLCESDPDMAYRVNTIGPRNLAIAAHETESKLISFSGAEVFDGSAVAPLNEFDTVNPVTVYGKSKAAGEQMIFRHCRRFVILRSCWVYGTGYDFVEEVMQAADNKQALQVPTNQYGAPTSARELAKIFEHFIQDDAQGIYHATCSGSCSRYEFAREILRISGKEAELIPAAEAEGSRREYLVLDNMMLRLEGIQEPADWKDALRDYMKRRYSIG